MSAGVPSVLRLQGAVLLQGAAVADVAHLVALGLRHRARVDGAAPSAHHRALLLVLNEATETLAADVRSSGHGEVRNGADGAQWSVGMGSESAARLLGITPDMFAGEPWNLAAAASDGPGGTTAPPSPPPPRDDRRQLVSDQPDQAAAALDQLSDAELLKALNATLAKRQRPVTEEELAAQQAREADAEYARYYPNRSAR